MTCIAMLQSTQAFAGPQAELSVRPRPLQRPRFRVALISVRAAGFRAVTSTRL